MDTKQKLTRKQQAFVDYYIEHPKANGTDAAMFAYNTTDRRVAAAISSENLTKPNIVACLHSYGDLSEGVIVGTMRDWGMSQSPRKRELAVNSAKYTHDKVFGRATIKADIQTSVVKIAINLCNDGEEPPAELL